MSRRRFHQLDKLSGIRSEMARVYRECRVGTLETMDGVRFIVILRALREIAESELLEQRLDLIEAAQAGPSNSQLGIAA